MLLRGGVLLEASGRTSGAVAVADVLELFDFCRLCGGGELQVVRYSVLRRDERSRKRLVGCSAYRNVQVRGWTYDISDGELVTR